MALLAVMLPVPAARVSPKAPSTVLLNVIFPIPAPVFNEEAAVKVITEAKLIASFVVVIAAPKETFPTPV